MPRRGKATKSANPRVMLLHKVVMLGDGGVGKTALVIQFCLQHFVEKHDSTIEDSYRKSVYLDGAPCLLEILDTASDEQYAAVRDDWIREGEAFLLVYSITSRSSFSRIKLFHDQILRVQAASGCEPSPICLIGNKFDCVMEREVTRPEGLYLARSSGIDYFLECSAKINFNVEKAFFDLVRALRVQGEFTKRRYQKWQSLCGGHLIIPSGENDSVDGRDRLARCLLHAVGTNNVKDAVEFLNAGADPNAQPTLSGSALHAAAAFGYLRLSNILLKRGARVNDTAAHESGTSPLQEAAAGGHLEVLKLLLHHGARLDQESTLRGTALHAAASRGRTQVVEYLLKRGADATKRSGPYEFALHAAAWCGSEDVVTALLNSGADIDAENADGCTALHMAAFTGSVDVILVLLDRGAILKMNVVSGRFGTALDAAGGNEYFDVVKILLAAGAKTHFGDRERDPHAVKPVILDPEPRGPAKLAMLPSDTDAYIEGLYDDVQGGHSGNYRPVTALLHQGKPDVKRDGFTTLSDPPDAKADIVFIHGLQGHPKTSWTYETEPATPQFSLWQRLLCRGCETQAAQKEDVFWPYDFLRTHPDFAASRIMTWGYDPGVTRSFFGAANSQNISQHANNLMVMLQQERKDDPQRPLIFVAHSLGGIIVKTALSISKQSTKQPHYMDIYLSTTGVIFLGTPHGGSAVANWGLISSNLTKLAMHGTSTRVPKGLTPNDEPLENLRKTFLQMLEDGHFSIHSFYETLPMTEINGLNGLVVPREFALVGHVKETSLEIHGNHANICKFGTTTDPGYLAVLGALQGYVKGTVSNSQHDKTA